jgi:hypothetical protein
MSSSSRVPKRKDMSATPVDTPFQKPTLLIIWTTDWRKSLGSWWLLYIWERWQSHRIYWIECAHWNAVKQPERVSASPALELLSCCCRVDRQVLSHSRRWRAHTLPLSSPSHDDQSDEKRVHICNDCDNIYRHRSSLVTLHPCQC